MIRRLFVCTTVLGCIAFALPQAVEAQCGSNPCYTINPPVYVHLTPSQAATQGVPTATLNMSMEYGVESHFAMLTPGTPIWWSWGSNNGAQALGAYYFINGDGIHHPWGFANTLNGNSNGTTSYTQSDVGNTYKIFFPVQGTNGATTQDVVTVTIVSGPAGTVVGEDKRPDNTYAQINTSGGGGSMAADFVECQAGQIHQCINATHTPYSQVSVTNQQTGDSLFHSKHVAGNVAKYNEQVSYGDSLCCIAVTEGDVLNFREDDEVDCSVAGPVPPPPKHQDVQFGLKITYTWVSALTKANGFHPQAPYCSDASSPPDWPGPFEATANTKSGEYAGAEEMYREVPAGQSFTGVPWSWWFSYISEPYVYPSHPFPPNCTNTDKGFKNGINVFWPLPGIIF